MRNTKFDTESSISLMYPVFQSTFFLYIVSTTNTCPLAFIRYLIATVVKG